MGHAVSLYARIMADLSVTTKSSEHIIPYAVLAVIVAILFYILPTLLLILYLIKVFHRLASKCHLDFIAISIFVDKIHGDYKNGLDGGRDMRSISGLYFILRVRVLALSSHASGFKHDGVHDSYVIDFALLLGCALMVVLLKPY